MNGFITTILIISGVILLIAAVLTTFRLLDGELTRPPRRSGHDYRGLDVWARGLGRVQQRHDHRSRHRGAGTGRLHRFRVRRALPGE